MSNYVKVTPLHLIDEDERGQIYDYQLKDRESFILLTRKAGSVSGNTYHEGKRPATNPKLFIVFSGSIKFSYRHIDDKQHQELIIDKPSKIEVQPFVTHSVEAITDMVVLECNAIADIENDRYRVLVKEECL